MVCVCLKAPHTAAHVQMDTLASPVTDGRSPPHVRGSTVCTESAERRRAESRFATASLGTAGRPVKLVRRCIAKHMHYSYSHYLKAFYLYHLKTRLLINVSGSTVHNSSVHVILQGQKCFQQACVYIVIYLFFCCILLVC